MTLDLKSVWLYGKKKKDLYPHPQPMQLVLKMKVPQILNRYDVFLLVSSGVLKNQPSEFFLPSVFSRFCDQFHMVCVITSIG